MNVLITGGAGFIGSTMVRQCLGEGNSLVVDLDKFTCEGHRSSLKEFHNPPDYVLVEGDIVDAKLGATSSPALRGPQLGGRR